MKRFLKILGYLVLGVIGLVVAAAIFIVIWFPRIEASAVLAIEPTAERIERGSYLVNQVLYCMNCHAERDWNYYGGPVVPGTEGKGALMDDPVLSAFSGNITPFGIGDWTDGEVARAITSGVNKDDEALNPIMPYDSYANMSEQDVNAVVAYLRTLAPIEFVAPEVDGNLLTFLLTNVIGRLLPKPYEPRVHPDESDPVTFGLYLIKIAECGVCHGSNYAGGRSFHNPPGQKVRAKNITPAPSGIGTWTSENFVSVFKSFASEEIRQTLVPEGEPNTGMPWLQYAGMTEADLGAIYDFLRTLEPIESVASGATTSSAEN